MGILFVRRNRYDLAEKGQVGFDFSGEVLGKLFVSFCGKLVPVSGELYIKKGQVLADAPQSAFLHFLVHRRVDPDPGSGDVLHPLVKKNAFEVIRLELLADVIQNDVEPVAQFPLLKGTSFCLACSCSCAVM